MNTQWVWLGVIIYIILSLLVALISRRGSLTDMEGYFLGGRKMNGFMSAMSYSATTYSAFMMVGLAGLTYQGGVGALGFEIVYFIGVSLVALFGPKFWLIGKKNGYVTPSEMIGDRYESKGVAMIIALSNCLFLIPYSAVQLAGVGYLLQGMTNNAIPFTVGVVLATALALLFSVIAGIRSVVWTDALQAIVMIITSTIVVLIVIHGLGGFGHFFTTLKEKHPESLAVPGNGYFSFTTFLSLTLPWFFFSMSNPQVSQRLYMPGSLRGLRNMLMGFLVFGFIYTLVSVLWGFSAFAYFPHLATADLATPKLLSSSLVPTALGIIVMIGILAAAVSTIDAILLTLSSLFSRDVYNNVKSDVSDRKQLQVGKVVLPIIAILAFIFAELQLNLISVLSVASSAGLIVVVPAIFGTFFWKRGTAAGVITSVVIGAIVVLTVEFSGMKPPLQLGSGVWGLIVSALVFIIVSFFTRAPSSSKTQEFMRIRVTDAKD
ncbi:pantothenate permease [Pullulanibacillus camelliae]|uniref:Pantothenate permease n=1 Tax=Pullulanibacillus camelliae TaxID=1707096 RepID=A0A8J2VER6_9BACL|nr:sodium:solute symporter family protein [Pullulanibacillus camelliae]GGE26258.1 pantothenate permease [Pullulanibacillus camelliae]